MDNSKFKHFKEAITQADKNAVVWFMGFEWLYLTPRQHDKIYNILLTKSFLKEETFNNHVGIEIPSGLFIIRREQQQ